MKIISSLLFLFAFISLSAQSNLPTITFEDIRIIPHDQAFQETKIGGLSGITRGMQTGEYLAVADKPDARYYTITIDKEFEITFKGLTYTLPKKGENESLRIHPVTKDLYIADERNRKTCLFKNQLDGQSPDEIKVPKKFKKMRQNSGFEGMTFSDDGKRLVLGLESALITESNCGITDKVSGITRILELDVEGKAVAEYAYPLLNLAEKGLNGNGLTELLHWKEDLFLVLERAYFPILKKNSIRIYLIDLAKADNVQDLNICELTEQTQILQPVLLFDFDTAIQAGQLKRVDNAEGMCWSHDKSKLIIVTDNNFNTKQETQFIQLSFKE